MLHFNELRISDDGKGIIIDVEVDDFPQYEDVYIDNIKIDIDTNLQNSGISSKAVTVWEHRNYLYGDIDGDGRYSEYDALFVKNLANSIAEYTVDELDQYRNVLDVNGDGEVTINDINQAIYWIGKGEYHYGDIIRERHVRLCLDYADIPTLTDTKDLSGHLFFVCVTAGTKGVNMDEVEKLGCGWGVTEITGVAYDAKRLYCMAVDYARNYGDDCDADASGFADFVLRYNAFMFALKCGDLAQAVYYWRNYLSLSTSTAGRLASRNCGCHGSY